MVLLSQAPVSQHRTRASRGILCSTSSNSHYVRTDEGDQTEQVPYTLSLATTQPEVHPEVPSHGVRTELCHICDHCIPFRDLSTHLKEHSMERKSRERTSICSNCGRTLDGVETAGELPSPSEDNRGLCRRCSTPKKPVSSASNQIGHRQQVMSVTAPCDVLSRSRKRGPLPLLSEHDYSRYLQYKRRSRKDRGDDGNEIWPDFVEEAFQAGGPKKYIGY